MKRSFIWLFSLWIWAPIGWCLPASAQSPLKEQTAEVSQRYLALDAERDYNKLRDLYADDATFYDPTGDVFQGAVAQGIVRGGDAVTALQRSWGLSGIDFQPELSFYVGQYAIHRGIFKAQFEGSSTWISIPFITIHHVVDGRIQSRMDFGEYIQSFGLGNDFDAATSETAKVAPAYLEAYFKEDFNQQRTFLDENATFQDPTAKVFGPKSGIEFSDAESIVERRKEVFQNISDFGMDIEKQFVANHHAVFIGKIKYKTASGTQYEQDGVIVIEVRGGKVTRHWDFVDYSAGSK